MCNFDPHRPWLSFSSLVNSSMSTCAQAENIFGREIDLTCLGVNVVVASKKVGQTHYEESKTEDMCDYCTEKLSIILDKFGSV